jgi:PAS domain-containing protein
MIIMPLLSTYTLLPPPMTSIIPLCYYGCMTTTPWGPPSGVQHAANAAIMYELDIESGKLQWSEALFTTFNVPPTEPISHQEWWVNHIHPDDAMILNRAMDKLEDPKIPNWTVEYRFRCGDGTYRPVRDKASIVRDETGNATRLIGVMTPIG